jgi:hypothetical protein
MTKFLGLRRWLALAFALAAFAAFSTWVRPCRALDSFAGTRTVTLFERAHSAVLTLGRDRAELVVRRSIWNAGPTSDQAKFLIELPAGAVATRLRSRGMGRAAPWFEGELLEAEEAAAKYRALTGLGGYYPKDPALLSWRDQGLLALQVFPCPPHAEKVVEYTLELPFSYENGARHVRLPAMGTPETPARVRLSSQSAGDRLRVDGKPFASGGILPRPGDDTLDIALSTQSASLEVELVSVPFASNRVLTRYAIRAAPRLSQLPKQAYVVVVVDASRSTGNDFETVAKSALDAYLAHLPDAHVEIMTFDRSVTPRLGGFGTTSAARYALQVLSLGHLNGSDVDLALFEADRLLATAPTGAPRRIVLVTDGLTRSTLTPERLRGAVAQSHAIVHVGLLGAGPPHLVRIDDHPWAEAIRSTGGLVWRAHAPLEAEATQVESQALAETYEEWARPLRIDRIDGFSDNFALVDDLQTASLSEGEGRELLYVDTALTSSLSVTGELWSAPLKVLAGRDEAQAARWSALVFGTPVLDELSEPEMMTLALKGRAVTPVTSYLAIEPGVRPSTEGLTEFDRLGQGWGDAKVRMGGTRSSGRAPQLDLQAFLDDHLRPAYEHCGGSLGGAYVDLETTKTEIVRVELGSLGDPLSALTSACFTEAVWALQLPDAFAEDWATFRVELGA